MRQQFFGLTTSHSHSNRFAIAGVQCFADIFVQDGSSAFRLLSGQVLRMKFNGKTPRNISGQALTTVLNRNKLNYSDRSKQPK
jgi:hypothetical protein